MSRSGILLGALAGSVLAGAGALALGANALAERTVRVRRHPPYRHRLLKVDGDQLVFARDRATELPGTYGVAWPGGHAVTGDVVKRDASTVTRRLERVQSGTLLAGKVALDHIDVGDPLSAFGLDFEHVAIDSPLGPMPAWVVPGARRDAWVLLAHGYGGSLASALSFLPLLHRIGCTCLVVGYRNDPGAPASPDRRYHLGASEWQEVDAALTFAAEQGAAAACLFGWSMGGAIVLGALERAKRRDLVTSLVLDSPVLDWRAVIHHVGRSTRAPRPLVTLVLSLIERKIDAPLSELDWLSRPSVIDVPVLCFHGELDELVPCELSKRLGAALSSTVELIIDPRAGHVGSFNVDPLSYEARLAAFVARTLLEPADERAGEID
ncbi:MAG: alpha/beta fold hydrolase [Actinomycetota bacterium]|nr:alpha/beta fold hydrolase [Actinomycetota bacterium]